MKAAPVTLVEYFVSDLSCAANRSYAEWKGMEIKPGDFSAEVSVKRINPPENRKWELALEIKHQAAPETNFPYAFRVSVIGFFTAAARVAEDEEERTVRIQGASVLYG